MSGEWTITGKQHKVDGVDKRLKKEARIQADRTPNGELIVRTNNAGEDNKVIEIVHDSGARLIKDSGKINKAERKERKEAKRERNENKKNR